MSKGEEITTGQIGQLIERNRVGEDGKRQITRELLQRFLENPLVVLMQITFHQLLSSCNFDYVNYNITEENFPITEELNENTEYVLVHLNKTATTDEAEAEIKRQGLSLATLADLLLYVKENPNKQKEFPIVALGSRWQHPNGLWNSPYADHWLDGRRLFLAWREAYWGGGYRFLACKR